MVTVCGNVATFRLYRPQAHEVSLAGNFNGWGDPVCRMVRGPGGHWFAALRLERGDHRFRYRVDGRWLADPAAFGIEHPLSGGDAVVHIEPRPESEAL